MPGRKNKSLLGTPTGPKESKTNSSKNKTELRKKKPTKNKLKRKKKLRKKNNSISTHIKNNKIYVMS